MKNTKRYFRFIARKVLKDKYNRNVAKKYSLNELEEMYSESYKIKVSDIENIYNYYLSKKNRGYVYVIGNLEYGFCKIGFSKKPYSRLKQLQTGAPFKLYVLRKYKGTIYDEKMLQKKYYKYQTHGEWFRIDGRLKSALNL